MRFFLDVHFRNLLEVYAYIITIFIIASNLALLIIHVLIGTSAIPSTFVSPKLKRILPTKNFCQRPNNFQYLSYCIFWNFQTRSSTWILIRSINLYVWSKGRMLLSRIITTTRITLATFSQNVYIRTWRFISSCNISLSELTMDAI